jgi:hypothetical protein
LAYGQPTILERTNLLLLEGAGENRSLEHFVYLCDLLARIKGEPYKVAIVQAPLPQGEAESRNIYQIDS